HLVRGSLDNGRAGHALRPRSQLRADCVRGARGAREYQHAVSLERQQHGAPQRQQRVRYNQRRPLVRLALLPRGQLSAVRSPVLAGDGLPVWALNPDNGDMSPAHRPAETPFERIGGQTTVDRLIDAFYDRMETLPEAAIIRRLHPEDLSATRTV